VTPWTVSVTLLRTGIIEERIMEPGRCVLMLFMLYRNTLHAADRLSARWPSMTDKQMIKCSYRVGADEDKWSTRN